jgi:hypothetical protein
MGERMESAAISLRQGRSSLLPVEDVYFAFGSGRLKYDCVTCGSQCCRGNGFILSGNHQLKRRLMERPQLGLFLTQGAGESQFVVRNCPPACFFLTQTGQCGIHANEGYDAKPELCRLFPFNDMRRVGQYLVVAPHRELCPLAVVDAGSVSESSSHKHLLQGMQAQGVAEVIPVAEPIGVDAVRLIELERAIVALSESHLRDSDYHEFAVAQLRATGQILAASGPQVAGALELEEAALSKFVMHASRILKVGGESRPAAAVVVRTLIATTPFLRRHLVLREAVPQAAWSPWTYELGRIPHVLYGLYILASEAFAAGMRDVTLQTISRLYRDFVDVLFVLAHADVPMMWRSDVTIELPGRDRKRFALQYLKIAKALLPKEQARHPVPLVDVLSQHNVFDGADGIIFLKAVAGRLGGRLVRCGSTSDNQAKHGSVRTRIMRRAQRWSLGVFDAKTIGWHVRAR